MASLSERGYNTGARSRGETFMSDQAIVLQGTIGPDGTLDVPDKVPLSAGRGGVLIPKVSGGAGGGEVAGKPQGDPKGPEGPRGGGPNHGGGGARPPGPPPRGRGRGRTRA